MKANTADQRELTKQFAHFFTQKDIEGMQHLFHEDLRLFDPKFKWVEGKKAVVDLLAALFRDTKTISYTVHTLYEEEKTTILEFELTLDALTLHGVDFIEWEGDKMRQIRSYFNPPEDNANPFS